MSASLPIQQGRYARNLGVTPVTCGASQTRLIVCAGTAPGTTLEVMSRRFPLLSQRQLEVLTWVGQGCPEDVWPDAGYKHTVYGLTERGLVTVDRRQGRWSATVTDDGRFYLEHGTYPDRPDQTPSKRSTPPRPANARRPATREPGREFPVSPTDLIAQLHTSGTPLTVPDPSEQLRAGYRRAIDHSRRHGLVPDGYALRYTGRNAGNLVISLVPTDEAAALAGVLDPVPVPDLFDDVHPVVRLLRDRHPQLLPVSEASLDRALRILHAIASECQRRDHHFRLRPDKQPTFQIQVGLDTFAFSLAEEYQKGDVVEAADLDRARYSWQRFPARLRDLPSGRLVLRLDEGARSVSWADRKRGTLEAKLPAVFVHLAQQAAAADTARADHERQRVERRDEWQALVEHARHDYVLDLNRARLREQAHQSTLAEELRRYTTRLQELLEGTSRPEEADELGTWIEFASNEADRCDPLLNTDQLRFTEPSDITPHQYGSFMPKGMNPWTPPE